MSQTVMLKTYLHSSLSLAQMIKVIHYTKGLSDMGRRQLCSQNQVDQCLSLYYTGGGGH
jgi:hypothetical protein